MPDNTPVLRQTVKWAENYVSSGLNSKLAGIIRSGIYHGFVLKPGGLMAVLVEHSPDYPRSVAVIERGGYSVTVIMDDPGIVPVPARGVWYVCLEALYTPHQQGYQRIVMREHPDSHHVILGKVDAGELAPDNPGSVLPTDPVIILPEMITTEERTEVSLATREEVLRIQDVLDKLSETTGAVQNVQEQLVKNVGAILEDLIQHEEDPNAHGGTTGLSSFYSGGGTRSAVIAADADFTVPSFVVGTERLEVYLDGLKCSAGVDPAVYAYKEVGTAGAVSSKIQWLQPINVLHEIIVRVI